MKRKLLSYILAAVMLASSIPAQGIRAAETSTQTTAETAEDGERESVAPGTEGETEAETKSRTETETETKSRTETETETRTKTETETEARTKTETEAGTEETTETEAETETETVTEETQLSLEELERLTEEGDTPPNAYKYVDYKPGELLKPVAASDDSFPMAAMAAESLPARYSSKEEGRTSSVKHQGSWGTCWSFSAVSAAESAYKKLKRSEANLSEKHLVRFFYNGNTPSSDLGGRLAGDKTTALLKVPVQQGGNDLFTTFALARWTGVANENTHSSLVYPTPQQTADDKNASLSIDSQYAFKDAVHLENAYWIPLSDRDSVKKAVMEYGTVGVMYYQDDDYMSSSRYPSSYYCPTNQGINHAVALAGWDDNFSKDNFKRTRYNQGNSRNMKLPQNDGAWLIKNSWGTSCYDGGYFWMSYEDATLNYGGTAVAFDFALADNYDNNYQYDGSTGIRSVYSFGNPMTAGAVYTADGDEQIAAVGVGFAATSTDYEVKVYTGLTDPDNPESGRLADTVTGTTSFEGFYTIALNKRIDVSEGEDFGIVVKAEREAYVSLFVDKTYQNNDWVKFDVSTSNDKTFVKSSDTWKNVGADTDPYTFRIKAYTYNQMSESGEYRVRFVDYDRTELKTEWVEPGGTATPPADPYRRGYEFKGWDGGDLDNITRNTTFTARYEAITYNITYELDGGTNAAGNPTSYTIETPDIVLQKPTKDGFVFDGWFKDGEYWEEHGGTIKQGSDGDITLYARWAVPKYVAIFVDYDETELKREPVKDGGTATPPEVPERRGYTFDGWDGGELTNITRDITFKARYRAITYNIFYELNGGTNAAGNPATYTIETPDIALREPTREDFVFGGWFNDRECLVGPVEKISQGSDGDITLYAKWTEAKGLRMTGIEPQKYTGSAVKPSGFDVYDGNILLTVGVDYTVSYKNNVNAYEVLPGQGEDKDAPTVIVRGKGKYSGTVEKPFTITPVHLSEAQVDDMFAMAGDSQSLAPNPKVVWNNKVLKAGTDYTVSAPWDCSGPGEYDVTITGQKNFTGTRTVKFKVAESGKKLISSVKASIRGASYTGSPIRPEITVKDGKNLLVEGTDYEIMPPDTYTDAGTHGVEIRGMGDYFGVRRLAFKITGTSIAKAKPSSWAGSSLVYDGEPKKPEPALKLNGQNLVQGDDYTITGYSNNLNAGTAKVTVAGKGKYSGTASYTFRITPFNIQASEQDLKVEFDNESGSPEWEYEKGGTRPRVKVSFEQGGKSTVLREGTDYKVTYKDNAAWPQKPNKRPKVVITGMRNFTQSKTVYFDISQKKLSKIGLMFVPDVEEGSKNPYSSPQLFDTNGKKLQAGVDYEKSIGYITGDMTAGAEVKVIVDGKGAYDGTHYCTYRVLPKYTPNISKASVSVDQDKLVYTGKEIKLVSSDLTVRITKRGWPIEPDMYEVEPYPDNPKIGKLKFLIRGKGEYGGVKTITVTVRPQTMKW